MMTEEYTCGKCGARVGNSKTHARWHDQLNDSSGADPEAAVSGDSAASESVEPTLTDLTAEPESCSCSEEAVMARVLASASMYDALLETEKDDEVRSADSTETPRRLRDLIYAALDAADVVMGRLPTLAESPQFVRYTHARAELRDYLTAEQEKTG